MRDSRTTRPSATTIGNFPLRRSYRSFDKKLRLRMAGVMHLNTFRQQTLPPPLAPSRQSGAATLRLHARTKTVLSFARAL
jgi:hypothetical protein